MLPLSPSLVLLRIILANSFKGSRVPSFQAFNTLPMPVTPFWICYILSELLLQWSSENKTQLSTYILSKRIQKSRKCWIFTSRVIKSTIVFIYAKITLAFLAIGWPTESLSLVHATFLQKFSISLSGCGQWWVQQGSETQCYPYQVSKFQEDRLVVGLCTMIFPKPPVCVEPASNETQGPSHKHSKLHVEIKWENGWNKSSPKNSRR